LYKKITDESINKILLYAYGSDNVKLLLSAINRGVDMKPLIYGSFLPRSDKTILEMSIFSNKNDDMTVALLEEASKQNNHASDVNKIFFNGVLTRCCKNLIAIEKIEILKKFLKKMPLIPDELYMSAMIFKKIEIALVLIENGANVNAFDPQNRKSLLQLALENKQTQIALALIEKGANVNAFDPQNRKSLLQLAIETKQTEIASALIQKGADLSLLFGGLPLANFILKKIEDQSKALEILKIIFAKNPDSIIQINVNYQHDLISHTKNLLHLACKNGFEEIVEYLLNSEDIPRDKRANPNLRDSSGNLPIVIVCENFRSSSENKLKMIDSLTRAGADLKIKDKEGYDLYRNAILIQDSKSFFEKIYKNRSTLEKIKTKLSGRDKILLKEAIQLSNLECIKCMYENLFPKAQGCSPASCLTISNKELNELFTLAVKDSKNLECAKFFLDKGADLNHQNSAGDKSIDIYLKNFLELPTENFLTSYTLDNFRPDDANYRTDIINITSGKTIKFLVENNCKIDDKTKKMLENFITANPNPDPDTREGMATALKLSFLTKLQSLIEQRIPLPLPLSPSAQLVRSQARANQSW
jgi:ankyrin repeat protein